ncbi:YdbH domain-containing protein [Novilysobacter antarcticus]|uniref:YdbH domain-containing protein n=1 Tax=Novilysobacter antarcticus TaxID=2862543 RepID=UPI001C99CEF3|nr:YdbH domain-containing protein [Lysobacter antarcticus]
MKIDRIESAVADLNEVSVRLFWPASAPHGELRLRAKRIDSPSLGYRFDDLDWRCRLQREDSQVWVCAGEIRSGNAAPMQLSIAVDAMDIDAELASGASRIGVHREAAVPDATRIDLTRVPLVWTQALLAQAWPAAVIAAGEGDARLVVRAVDDQPLRISGPVVLRGAGLDTEDGSIAAADLDTSIDVDARLGESDLIRVEGRLDGGELLWGTTYLALEQRRIDLRVGAEHHEGEGWKLPELYWNDPGILTVEGSAGLDADNDVDAMELHVRAPDLGPLRDGYLSGWLGMAGLGEMTFAGAANGSLRMRGGQLADADLRLSGVDLKDADDRFSFAGLEGDVALSSSGPIDSALQWRGGTLHGMALGPARLPFRSEAGNVRLREAVAATLLGGNVLLNHLLLRPPLDADGAALRFGVALEDLDVAQLSKALDWPAFTGTLSGSIPDARYQAEQLILDGGLEMQLFGGRVGVSALSMERPFGVLPTLSADIQFDDIDLTALTGAFDFGSISGKLDGSIADLRLVGWEAVAFDARLVTDRHRGVRQRISQRAVQDLTSVGNASFVNSLQSQLIGFFDDFGYSRLGIGCKLVNEVCTMEGLAPAGEGFVLVEGAGVPRLTVLGFNRRVDWPTLVERLAAVGKGEVKAVVD